MTRPDQNNEPSLADVAAEPSEETVAHEREIVGDEPDTGDTVSEDRAQ